MMPKYHASIEYNNDTIMSLSSSINSTFRLELKAIYLLICLLLIIAGTMIGMNTPTGLICVAFGCFFLPSVNAQEKRQARNQIKQMNGQSLHVDYTFTDSCFICSNSKERNEYSYSSIIRLVKEANYYYLFPNSEQAYMIDRSSITPNDEERFEGFISSKVGLQWTQKMSLLTLSIKQWRFNKANTKIATK